MDGVSEFVFLTPTVGALGEFYVPASMQAMPQAHGQGLFLTIQ